MLRLLLYVWPLTPRFTYGFPVNCVGKYFFHPSVIELPMNTTRFSAAGRTAFESRYFARFGQSVVLCACIVIGSNAIRYGILI